MPVAHCSIYFAQGSQSWVEQFWRSDTTLDQSLAAVKALAFARWSILGKGVAIYKVRAVELSGLRVGIADIAPGTALAAPAMPPIEGALISLVAGKVGLYKRSYLLRGLPQGALEYLSGHWLFSATYASRIQGWLSLLVSGNWQLQCWGRSGPRYQITNVAQSFLIDQDFGDIPEQIPTPYTVDGIMEADVVGLPTIPEEAGLNLDLVSVRLSRVKWTTKLKDTEGNPNQMGQPQLLLPGKVLYVAPLPIYGSYAYGGTLQLRPRLYLPITRFQLVKKGTAKCGGIPKSVQLEKVSATPPPMPQGAPYSYLMAPPGPPQTIPGYLGPYVNRENQGPRVPQPVVVPPPLPPGPPPFQVPPPPIRPVTLDTLLDVGTFLLNYLGYGEPPPLYTPIGIAPVRNLLNTWWIGAVGLYLTPVADTGITSAITNALGFPNTFAAAFLYYINNTIPPDAKILAYGHSLGGMVVENICNKAVFRDRVVNVVTFGSPIPGQPLLPIPVRRFKVLDDAVPRYTPLGTLAALAGNLGYIVVPPDPRYPFYAQCHRYMPLNPALANYDPWGFNDLPRHPSLVLGTMQFFKVPVTINP